MAAEAQATLQATDRISWQASVAPVVALASIGGLLLLAASGSRSLALAVLAFSAPPAIGWAATWLAAIAQSHTRIGDLTFDDTARHLRYAAPVIPTFALGYVSDWGDHVLLSRYSTLAEVGQFALAYQFMVAAMAAGGVLVTVMLPRLIAHELTQPGYMRTYVEREVPTLCALWMLGTIWVVAAMPLVVRLIAGAQFDEFADRAADVADRRSRQCRVEPVHGVVQRPGTDGPLDGVLVRDRRHQRGPLAAVDSTIRSAWRRGCDGGLVCCLPGGVCVGSASRSLAWPRAAPGRYGRRRS